MRDEPRKKQYPKMDPLVLEYDPQSKSEKPVRVWSEQEEKNCPNARDPLR